VTRPGVLLLGVRVTATEYRFAPDAAQYITKFFQDVTDKVAK
jgi:hypothetical protein